MSYSLRPAITSEAKPLIGLYAESGCGKTKSALLLAKGFAGDMSKVAMIETESGRGEVYADDPIVGGYLVRPIRENFSPTEYGKALTEVEKAGVKVCIIDSASHEWEGAGGVLGMAAQNQADGKKGPLVWQQPKMQHQREFMLRLMQTPIPLVIVCMRAKYVMEEIVKDGRKEWARSKDLSPKQSEDILYEMMVHAWIDQQHKLHVTKYTKDDFKKIFVEGELITVTTGQRLAKWAAGTVSLPQPTAAGAGNETVAAAQVGLDDRAPSNTQGNMQAHPATSGENPLPTAAAIDDAARAKLAAAGSMGALEKAWAEIGPTARIKLEAYKEACKKRITAADKVSA